MSEIQNLTPEQVSEACKNGIAIIDIRTPAEWMQTGTISKSHRIMFFNETGTPVVHDFMPQFESVVKDKNQEFVLVCRSGARTAAVANFLKDQMGYTHVMHLAHGMNQWLAENREVEK